MISFLIFSVIFASNHQSPLMASRAAGQVAVIGSGAGGSSVAYFLSKLSPATSVTVFEKSDVVGGRAKYLSLNLTICSPNCANEVVGVELGASIFANSNKHLVEAAKEFGLSYEDRASTREQPILGIWNGKEFLVYHNDSWLSKLKLMWRYAYSLIKAPRICKELVKKFVVIYENLENNLLWQNHGDEVDLLDVRDTLSVTCKEYFLNRGVSERYIDEFLGGIVRNIYLTDVDQLHAFACNVGLFASIDEVFRIKGGNKKLFEKMLSSSDLVLKSTVKSIEKVVNGIEVFFEYGGRTYSKIFDHVVVANPEITKIDFKGVGWNHHRPQFTFVKLYVTVVYGVINPGYFGYTEVQQIPGNILTPKGHNAFNCFATVLLNATHSISKIFSKSPLSNMLLDQLFSQRTLTETHSWDSPGAYPLLTPSKDWDLPVGKENVYFLNSMERWVSTMETETIAAKNIALNILHSSRGL